MKTWNLYARNKEVRKTIETNMPEMVWSFYTEDLLPCYSFDLSQIEALLDKVGFIPGEDYEIEAG